MKRTLRVLNVEDQERDVALLTRHLARAGYDLVSERVETAEAMRAALESQGWDVILCDYSMPQFNALAALALLKETGLDIPFIIISGTVGEAVAVEAMRAGAHDYLMKDNLVRLAPTIERELHEADNRRARKVAEDSLKASEAELRALFAAISDVILVLDAEGRFQRIAPTSPTYLYKPSAEMIGKRLHEVFPKEQADFFLGHIRRALAEGRMQSVEYSLQIAGAEVWFDGSVSPMSEDLVVWIARDVTERKRAEEENRKLLRDLAERVKELMALHEAARLLQREWADTATVVRQLAEILRPAFQHAEVATARVSLGRTSASGPGFSDSPSALRADFTTADGQPGSIEVVYTERRPPAAEGPFLAEERALVNTLADMLRTAYDRRQTERAMRESEERFRQLAENIREVFWMRTPGIEEILYVSPAYESVWGMTREIAYKEPRSFLDAIHPEDRQRTVSVMETEQWRGFEIEYRIVRPDGRVRWIWDRGFPVKDESGATYRIAGIAEDITDRKRAEQELRESEERYRDLVENARDIIYSQDLEGKYISINKAGEQITGYTREEALGMNVAQIVAPEHFEKARQMIAQKLAGEDKTVYDLEIISKDGRRVAVEVSSRLVFQDGVAVGVQGIARDISERKQLEEQLRQSQKMEAIGMLAGGVAHDFNNLLTAILGNTQLAARRLATEDPLRQRLDEIREAAERAAKLTSQLLAFSRRQHLERRTISLNDTVGEIMKMVRRIIGEDVEVHVKESPDLPPVYADPAQIEQVVLNLAVNARDAMPGGGRLTIETHKAVLDESYCHQHSYARPGRYVEITVSDTGTGMDAATRERIFEPFFTTKGVGKGTGLGLAMIYGIVKQHDGHINVYSEPGQGTTFKVYLPVADGEAEENSAPEQQPILGGTETILVAEDEEALRRLVKDVLEGFGYKVLLAKDGEEAVEMYAAARGRVDLLLLDVVMPRLGGQGAYERIRALGNGVPVIFMTGYSIDTVQDRFVKSEVLTEKYGAALIQKPYTVEGLGRKVREVLDGGGA
ncbi:MAG TPA: PAS domain S-box protein [Pyrinomonadaceae bacterium]|jgi:PAS domain S-box-containing protein|nr:PAS domain S-box protein [Pyrinomonadaceae bacterium]